MNTAANAAVQHRPVPGPRTGPAADAPAAAALIAQRATELAAAERLRVLATGAWDCTADGEPPGVAGFIVSTFSPLAAAAAARAMSALAAAGTPAYDATAVLIVSAHGDVVSARTVAAAVDAGDRVGPLMFFQSVPNAIAGHIATTWRLTGPVLAISPAEHALRGGVAAGFAQAAMLLDDGDAGRVLAIFVEQAAGSPPAASSSDAAGDGAVTASDRALAVVVDRPPAAGEENQ